MLMFHYSAQILNTLLEAILVNNHKKHPIRIILWYYFKRNCESFLFQMPRVHSAHNYITGSFMNSNYNF